MHASLLPHPAHTDWTPGRPARGRNWSHAAAAAPVITPDTGRRRRRRRRPSVRPSVRRPINRYAAVRSGRLGLAASPRRVPLWAAPSDADRVMRTDAVPRRRESFFKELLPSARTSRYSETGYLTSIQRLLFR